MLSLTLFRRADLAGPPSKAISSSTRTKEIASSNGRSQPKFLAARFRHGVLVLVRTDVPTVSASAMTWP